VATHVLHSVLHLCVRNVHSHRHSQLVRLLCGLNFPHGVRQRSDFGQQFVGHFHHCDEHWLQIDLARFTNRSHLLLHVCVCHPDVGLYRLLPNAPHAILPALQRPVRNEQTKIAGTAAEPVRKAGESAVRQADQEDVAPVVLHLAELFQHIVHLSGLYVGR